MAAEMFLPLRDMLERGTLSTLDAFYSSSFKSNDHPIFYQGLVMCSKNYK